MLFFNVSNTQGHGDIGDMRKNGAYTLETSPSVEICSKTRPHRYSRSEVRRRRQDRIQVAQISDRTGNYRHNLLDSHRKWNSCNQPHRHSRSNRNSYRSCQQSVMAFFVFFSVFLCPELFDIVCFFFQLWFFFSVHFHRFLQHFGAGNCYFNDMCNIVELL